jgi:hypothetical protein
MMPHEMRPGIISLDDECLQTWGSGFKPANPPP